MVDQVSLQVLSGSVVGLLGPNGAGKTTTFYSIVGFIRPTSGAIFLDEEDIAAPARPPAGGAASPTWPRSPRCSKLTVEENIRIVLEPLGLSAGEIQSRIGELLAELKIERLAGNKGHITLSGGERRRVEIMRALATRPRFILLDGPFAGVDPLSVADLQQIIRDLKQKGARRTHLRPQRPRDAPGL